MNNMQQAGIEKKSFELNYNGGTIWCEHLDGMGSWEESVISKFSKDIDNFSKPSVSSYMIINLDKTDITEGIVEVIISTFLDGKKSFRKIAFVGVGRRWQKQFNNIKKRGIIINYLSDYEKAKEWLF